jgi:hypothetical protein
MIPLSDNHYSLDNQIDSAVTYLWHAPELKQQAAWFNDAFPEYAHLIWQDGGAWIDAEASQVDPEFMSWVCDWIERFTPIFWEEGEPWLPEPDDEAVPGETHDEYVQRMSRRADRPDLAGNWFDHIEQGGA